MEGEDVHELENKVERGGEQKVGEKVAGVRSPDKRRKGDDRNVVKTVDWTRDCFELHLLKSLTSKVEQRSTLHPIPAKILRKKPQKRMLAPD